MSKELATAFAKRFIQRRDVKAVQLDRQVYSLKQGDWMPHRRKIAKDEYEYLPWKMSDLTAHIAGEKTYGHYLLDADSKCKLFAFDIDLKTTGSWVRIPDLSGLDPSISNEEMEKLLVVSEDVNPRALWADRRAVEARTWYKYQMKQLAHKFLTKINELDIPCAAAYSGSKGVHVYGFTGSMPAKEVREGAMLVLDMLDEFEASKGRNFYEHKNKDPHMGFPSFSVEVFPKQDTLENKDLGNLMRLPLGKNEHNPKDPTFFLDMTTPLGVFSPHSNPLKLLETGQCFA